MKKIILLTIVLWGLLAPITFHPDTKLTLRYAALENSKVWDIYGYLSKNKLDIPDFHYPPAHYWWLKIHYPISKLIGGNGFDNWLSSGSAQASLDGNIFRYNLAAKFPLLLLGLVSGWIIFKIVKKISKSENKGRLAAIFWYFNPITIYSLVLMGQNDIVAIFLFLLGIVFIENKWWFTVVLWGLAAGVKSYPIIWAIMFLLVWEKNIGKLIIKSVGVVAIYGLILLPWLGKSYFTQAVLNSGLSQRMFVASIPIGFEKSIILVPMLLIVIALRAWNYSGKEKVSQAALVIFQSCLVILGFSHFNPQWMLWTIPFLSIWLGIKGIIKSDILAILLILGSWIVLMLGFDDKFLTWGIIAPISPNLLNYPTLVNWFSNKGVNLSNLINFCQSVLAGVSVYYLTNRKIFKIKSGQEIILKKWLIIVPWILIIMGIMATSLIKVELKNSANKTKDVIQVSRMVQEWEYKTENNLKYFEISLNNPGLMSKDKAILVVRNDSNKLFKKEFSAFNAGDNSWLRVDVPVEMRNSKMITLSVENISRVDGLLTASLDDRGRWAVNFYNTEKLPLVDVYTKMVNVWWWLIVMLVTGGFYLLARPNNKID